MENKDLVVVKEQVTGMKAMLESTKVTNQDELKDVSDRIKKVKSLKKLITEKKDAYVAPAKAIIAEAKLQYDPFINECERAEEVLKGKASVYLIEESRKAREAQDKIAAKVESGYIKPETAIKKLEALPETKTSVNTGESSLKMNKRKVAKITDPTKVPDEFWVIDEVAVRKEALIREKSGAEQIPGVTIEEEVSLASL